MPCNAMQTTAWRGLINDFNLLTWNERGNLITMETGKGHLPCQKWAEPSALALGDGQDTDNAAREGTSLKHDNDA